MELKARRLRSRARPLPSDSSRWKLKPREKRIKRRCFPAERCYWAFPWCLRGVCAVSQSALVISRRTASNCTNTSLYDRFVSSAWFTLFWAEKLLPSSRTQTTETLEEIRTNWSAPDVWSGSGICLLTVGPKGFESFLCCVWFSVSVLFFVREILFVFDLHCDSQFDGKKEKKHTPTRRTVCLNVNPPAVYLDLKACSSSHDRNVMPVFEMGRFQTIQAQTCLRQGLRKHTFHCCFWSDMFVSAQMNMSCVVSFIGFPETAQEPSLFCSRCTNLLKAPEHLVLQNLPLAVSSGFLLWNHFVQRSQMNNTGSFLLGLVHDCPRGYGFVGWHYCDLKQTRARPAWTGWFWDQVQLWQS